MFETYAMLLLVLCCFVAQWSPSRAKQLKSYLPRVHHGRDAQPGEYTYVVLFIFDREPEVYRFISGSMISPQWVLTCAHGHDVDIAELVVWYGNFTVSPWQSKLYTKILKIYTHRSYKDLLDHEMWGTDIALYQVRKKADLFSLGTISAVDYTTLIGLPVTYVGGGGTDRPEGDELRPLQVGEGAIVPCDIIELKNSICIASRCSHRLAQPYYGDSGGPLLYDGKIIGVLSQGHYNELIIQDAFTPVSPNLDWIYEAIRQDIQQ